MKRKDAAAIGAGVGAQYGVNAARLASSRGATSLKHPAVAAGAAGALVGAATGAGAHTLYRQAHPHFQNAANKFTDRSARIKAAKV